MKGWAGGRRPRGSSVPIPGWDGLGERGCGAPLPDLLAEKPESRGLSFTTPSNPHPRQGVAQAKVAPRDGTCAGPGGGRRIAGLSGTPPSTGRRERPEHSAAAAAAAAAASQRALPPQLGRRPAPLPSSTPPPPPPPRARARALRGAPALGHPPADTRRARRHLLVSIQSLPCSMWPACINIYDLLFLPPLTLDLLLRSCIFRSSKMCACSHSQ